MIGKERGKGRRYPWPSCGHSYHEDQRTSRPPDDTWGEGNEVSRPSLSSTSPLALSGHRSGGSRVVWRG